MQRIILSSSAKPAFLAFWRITLLKLLACLWLCATTSAGLAIAQEEEGPPRRDRRERPGREFWNREEVDEPERDFIRNPIDNGLLFIDGEFLAPPYILRIDAGNVLVNDRPLPVQLPSERREWRQPPGMRLQILEGPLSAGHAVLAFTDEPLAVLTRAGGAFDLITQLLEKERMSPSLLNGELPQDFDRARFDEWVAQFEPTPALREHGGELLREIRASEQASRDAIAAVHRKDTLTYLITVFGMVITVAATGHLISQKPPGKSETEPTPEMLTMVSRSLALVVVLSSLDLFWTIMAAQSQRMVELNPLGSHLLQDPAQLIAFKAIITCSAVGLLYFLRHHRQAQVAAWWACLICTLLTYRWLTFNSMFMS